MKWGVNNSCRRKDLPWDQESEKHLSVWVYSRVTINTDSNYESSEEKQRRPVNWKVDHLNYYKLELKNRVFLEKCAKK